MAVASQRSVGSSSANSWATYVAVEKGLFTAAGIKPDIVHAQSNASVIQQLAASLKSADL